MTFNRTVSRKTSGKNHIVVVQTELIGTPRSERLPPPFFVQIVTQEFEISHSDNLCAFPDDGDNPPQGKEHPPSECNVDRLSLFPYLVPPQILYHIYLSLCPAFD